MKLYRVLELMDKNNVVIFKKGVKSHEITKDMEDDEIKEIKPNGNTIEIVLHHESYHKRRYREYKEKGLCPKCGRPNDTKKTYCTKCEEEQYKSKGLMFVYREMTGRCKTCGETLTKQDKKESGGYFKNCKKCREHMRNKNNKNLALRKDK